MVRNSKWVLPFFFVLALSVKTYGQSPAASGFTSPVDDALTIRNISVLTINDNVDGIYARPIQSLLIQDLKDNYHYNYVDSSFAGATPSPEDLEEDQQKVQSLGKSAGADAFIIGKATKGPNGLSVVLDLFQSNTGQLMAQAKLKDYPRFEIPELQDQTRILERQLLRTIPYDGVILSRTGDKITVNVGRKDGVSPNQVIDAILIVKANRHPKFHFLISTDKEILGKIKLTQVDDTLSFGTILSEREKNAVQKGTKIAGIDFVTYKDPTALAPLPETAPAVSSDKTTGEWVPLAPPTFGQVGIRLGLGSYTNSYDLSSTGGIQGHAAVFPNMNLMGELWLNPRWLVRANISQGIVSVGNPIAGSSPSDLSILLSSYDFAFGYNILMRDDFWGPKLTLLAGYYQFKDSVAESNPVSLTSLTYSGFSLGLEGSLPLDVQKIWTIGADFNFVFQPNMSEGPVSSGSPGSNTMNRFSLFGRKKLGVNLQAVGSIDFQMYSTSFSGGGSRVNGGGQPDSANSASQISTVVSGGVNYLF